MEKELAEAMKNIFPNAEHRVCIRHLWKNLRKFFNYGDTNKVRSLVWTASNSFIRHEFDAKLEELFHVSPQLHSYLLAVLYKWSKCDFSTNIKNHYNINNMSESLNSWIKETRTKPVVDLVDMIRAMLMELRAQRKMILEGWLGEFVLHAEEYIREITTRKDQFIIRHTTSVKAEVEGNFGRQIINIESKECICRFWQVTGLPCIHAVVFIGTKQNPLWHTYVNEHYHVVRYRMAYEGSISALPSKEQCVVVGNSVQIGVPNTLRPRGRSKKRRFKSFMESQNSQRGKSSDKCSCCGLWGHHRSSCKNPLTTEAMMNNDQSAVSVKLPVRRDRAVSPGMTEDLSIQ